MTSSQDRPRGGRGQFVRSLSTAERDAEAARLRSLGWSYPRIAAELGWKTRADAHNAVKRVLKETVREAGDDVRTLELERLDRLEAAANEVLEREHVTVSNGRVVVLHETPLPDDGPVLAAIDRLLKIQERRARLLGLDAPTKQAITITPERAAALEQLVAELGE
ncbi:hypothetical protein ACZ90_25050 [Streptomyces albus subsp. albus]|nr:MULTISPECIES: hypothetical protein [Streptomyces]KOG84471.1 hypothetical protein ADK33_03450 [Streptomyces griseus subsp. rhodochrous]KUJ67761.1 hypothetical protein ACZ90_25050 [Streptomyces albus subsp. albus]